MLLKIIVEYKKEFVSGRKRTAPLAHIRKFAENATQSHNFIDALRRVDKLNVIAEIKKASPSAGLIRENFNYIDIAHQYEDNGASALSILTDEKFFQGSDDVLEAVRKETELPILRKDFIIDEYQIYESRSIGADAILLIMTILDRSQLCDYLALANELGMAALVEAHTEHDLEKACLSGAKIIGINNRDLETFTIDIKVTERLMKFIPKDKVTVSESGIKTAKDMKYLNELGVDAVLVGEVLMRYENPGDGLKELLRYNEKINCGY